jgi:hypothetical protein
VDREQAAQAILVVIAGGLAHLREHARVVGPDLGGRLLAIRERHDDARAELGALPGARDEERRHREQGSDPVAPPGGHPSSSSRRTRYLSVVVGSLRLLLRALLALADPLAGALELVGERAGLRLAARERALRSFGSLPYLRAASLASSSASTWAWIKREADLPLVGVDLDDAHLDALADLTTSSGLSTLWSASSEMCSKPSSPGRARRTRRSS